MSDYDRYPEIPPDRDSDLVGMENLENADVVLFMAGNQFMVMPELIAAFQQRYPEVEHICYETLPPGLELRQILTGGAVFGGRLLTVVPDVYSSVSVKAMHRLEDEGFIRPGGFQPYLHNRLVLMVPEGNPAGIESIHDLARSDVRISQPDPQYEDIAGHIQEMYRRTAGDDLVQRIMVEKREQGSTRFTIVHHRETPLRLTNGEADVGPVWATEAAHAQKSGLAIDVIEPGAAVDGRDRITYFICRLQNGAHPINGEKFINFVLSPDGQKIFAGHGFLPHAA
jgi:ABC-type molybdate transport system substrate-binding protein